MSLDRRALALLPLTIVGVAFSARVHGQATPPPTAIIDYTIAVPEPERRYVQVTAVFPAQPGKPLVIQMSRSSPGRYALHDFVKNVFAEAATNAAGQPIGLDRSGVSEWTAHPDQASVSFSYRVYGDTVDGTYLAVDETHAHLNMPATLAWVPGLESVPARIRLVPPPGRSWHVATQLYPTGDPLVFRADNLAYLMDSPIEFSETRIDTFRVPIRDGGPEATIRFALHQIDPKADISALLRQVQRVVIEERAVFGELPAFEPGDYTFIADYLPWAKGDGMEHRNSTVITGSWSPSMAGTAVLDSVAHEFFHSWNVERIRPRSLEPFDLTRVNVSGELWLAEGFTNYYGPLALTRAGLTPIEQWLAWIASTINAVRQAPGHSLRSVDTMSRLAGLIDGAHASDATNTPNTFLSYYTWGSAIALGLDLALREQSQGQRSLDDFMRVLWRRFGAPGGQAPGVVDHPYSRADLIAALAEVAGSQTFAKEFFDRYIEGTEVPEYERLLANAGLLLRPTYPGAAWIGSLVLDDWGSRVRVREIPLSGTPAWAAGFAQDDVILRVGDVTIDSVETWRRATDRKPGTVLAVQIDRRGARSTLSLTVGENPELDVTRVERDGGTLTPDQQKFREAWLQSKAGQQH